MKDTKPLTVVVSLEAAKKCNEGLGTNITTIIHLLGWLAQSISELSTQLLLHLFRISIN